METTPRTQAERQAVNLRIVIAAGAAERLTFPLADDDVIDALDAEPADAEDDADDDVDDDGPDAAA